MTRYHQQRANNLSLGSKLVVLGILAFWHFRNRKIADWQKRMAEDCSEYDDVYIFSKDRRNRSVTTLDRCRPIYESVNDYNYVNLSYSEPRIENERSTQKSLPNLKHTNQSLYTRNLLSESAPLLGNHYQKRRYFCYEAIEYTRTRQTQVFLILYIVFYLVFLVGGSICFQQLEFGAERQIRQQFREAREDFLNDHPSISGAVWWRESLNSHTMCRSNAIERLDRLFTFAILDKRKYNQLRSLVCLIRSRFGKIYCGRSEGQQQRHISATQCNKWTQLEFRSSIVFLNDCCHHHRFVIFSNNFRETLHFSVKLFSCVGYGHVTPLSEAGKIFCMLYATAGIPMTLVLLSAVVERLLVPTNWLLGKLNSKLGHLYQPFNIRVLHLAIIVGIVGVFFVGIPTMVFAFLEDSWDGLDAFYYCFISLTTIGLGDYIPGDDPDLEYRSIYKICTTFYLIFGKFRFCSRLCPMW